MAHDLLNWHDVKRHQAEEAIRAACEAGDHEVLKAALAIANYHDGELAHYRAVADAEQGA